MGEHGESLAAGQRCCRCKQTVESRIARGGGDVLGGDTVVGNKVRLAHPEKRSRLAIGEVKYLEVDRYPTNTATHLEIASRGVVDFGSGVVHAL